MICVVISNQWQYCGTLLYIQKWLYLLVGQKCTKIRRFQNRFCTLSRHCPQSPFCICATLSLPSCCLAMQSEIAGFAYDSDRPTSLLIFWYDDHCSENARNESCSGNWIWGI